MESIESKNSKIIDRSSERRSFIENPRELQLLGDGSTDSLGKISISRHPDIPEMGIREWDLGTGSIFISENDYSEGLIRLKDFADIDIKGDIALIVSKEKTGDLPIIHWVSSKNSTEARMIVPQDSEIEYSEGIIENIEISAGQCLQLERMGFATVEDISENNRVSLIWLHG